MSIKKLVDSVITEAPLPSDWDSDIYSTRVPFKTRVEYAKARAQQVGRGSSRVVFKIPYQGRDTALKIALNRKGQAQNDAEAELLGDWYIRNMGLVVPLIDYDEKSPTPTWVHTEFAKRATPSDLKRALAGANIYDVVNNIIDQFSPRKYRINAKLSDATMETDLYTNLQDLAGNFGTTLIQDLSRAANWGMYRGKPVIVDLGYTDDTKHLYGG